MLSQETRTGRRESLERTGRPVSKKKKSYLGLVRLSTFRFVLVEIKENGIFGEGST